MTVHDSIQPSTTIRQRYKARCVGFLAGLLAAVCAMPAMSVDIAPQPLYIGSDVPGNLALVPSVEFPTAISRANLDDDYDEDRTYVGYFDPAKCYGYSYSNIETERHFYPVRTTGNHECPGSEWSGNFMNWAATQTIDPFRKALTGGYRVKDTVSETWVEKAIADRDSTSNFPRYNINNNDIDDATPVEWSNRISMRIDGLGNKMRFTERGNVAVPGVTLIPYDPASHPLDNGIILVGSPIPLPVRSRDMVYEVSIRVKVCDNAVGLESNCVAYPSGYYKPEGLIQEYSNRILYSIFGYQNVDGSGLDGGILRANQKFVGPQTHFPELGPQANAGREWDAATGVLFQNPDNAAAASTTAVVGQAITNSGVINYLNKFGQMSTGKLIKSNDQVSELYYAAVRYFKNLGNVPEYSQLTGSAGQRYQSADAFPVITNWQDPIRYDCQTNVVLGIGDTNTWYDKNLPGPTSGSNEPGKPPLVIADTSVNVVETMERIWRMEGYNAAAAATMASSPLNASRSSSAYMAALAYDSHVRDIRADRDGSQTLSTHWVDVVEFSDYKNSATNQYWLTGKYGGFRVPAGYNPANTTPLPAASWRQNTDTVPGSPSYPRADNFYVAADAQKMVDSLELAFKNILREMQGSGSSFASNTTKLEVGARTYQAQFYSGEWGGDLSAFDANPATGALTLAWSASNQFPVWGPTNATTGARKIYYRRNATTLENFQWGSNFAGTPLSGATEPQINYLRGDRSLEGTTFRTRRSVLGDIVNSQPVYVGSPNSRLYLGQSFTGASAYPAFAAANVTTGPTPPRVPVVYVGANDGMLHAFNANTGAEIFAFLPRQSMAALIGAGNYSSPSYQHKFSVDGELTAADVYTGGSWKTILVGTLGRGGKSVFALNVTNPASPSLLWELDTSTIPQLGNTLGKPIIAQVADGDWRVFLGNGPNSSSAQAQLLGISLSTGAVTVVNTGSGGDNGLSGVNAWASTSSGFVDTVYAGDLRGTMWKISNPAGTATSQVLFSAGTTQPITATPLVARNPASTDTWVFFGTGRYLNTADVANKDVQSWYGVIDKGTLPVAKASLNPISILAEGQVSGRDVRAIESYSSTGANGWYMDLVSPGAGGQRGERMVVSNFFQGLTLIGTTRIPDSNDVCSPSGKGFTMAIDPFTGGRLPRSFFDVNGDGSFNAGDTLGGIPVSGIGYNSSPNNPIFIGDVMYTSLDDGGSAVTRTSATLSNLRRVMWRELIRE